MNREEMQALAGRLETIELRLLMGDQHDQKIANEIGLAAHALRASAAPEEGEENCACLRGGFEPGSCVKCDNPAALSPDSRKAEQERIAYDRATHDRMVAARDSRKAEPRVWRDALEAIQQQANSSGPGTGGLVDTIHAMQKTAQDALALAPATEDGGREEAGALTKIAAECHRAKWIFDLNDEARPNAAALSRDLVKRAFAELHRIGDMAMKLRSPSPSVGTPEISSADRGDAA